MAANNIVIIGCGKSTYWYKTLIGILFQVIKVDNFGNCCVFTGDIAEYWVDNNDCVFFHDTKIKINDN